MKPTNLEARWSYAIASLIRQHLYVGGKEPEGWTIARDLRIARRILIAGHTDLGDAIRGLRLIYNDGRPLTLKYFASIKSRSGEQLYHRAAKQGRTGEPPKVDGPGLRAVGAAKKALGL